MLKPLLDAVMQRRARQLVDAVRVFLPLEGPLLDLGSGTGHVSALLEQQRGVDVIAADVSDIHVTGRRPVIIADGALPFESQSFSAALLLFMLAYPADPVAVLREAARVTRGPIIIVQTLSSGRIGRAWHRAREFTWTVAAFHVSKVVGYVPRDARFSMNTRRFYSAHALQRDVMRAGLRVRSQRERAVLPGRALVVVAWMLEPND
ncbi:MAG TPA: class I SAM-dependent methyltransferase [Gemmatimonadaceae bacterium]|nr:class I SAM-dependent methyltransferase [Gemmatimonadaceae bacterium]